MSEIALGSWLTIGGYVDADAGRRTLDAAFEAGINFFDTADVYSKGEAERALGPFLADVPRKDVFVASKCFFPAADGPNDRGLSRKHVVESLNGSLSRLGLDYLDLFQCHRYDPDTPLEETVAAMTDLVRAGKTLYWGVSMWSAAQIARACAIARAISGVAPVSNQPLYNLLDRGIEEEVIPVSIEEGLGQVVFSPLAQGALTGKYGAGDSPKGSRAARKGPAGQFIQRYLEPERLAVVERLRPIADAAGLTLAQLALAWCLRLRGVSSVIMGASSPEQLAENVGASGIELTDGMLEEIEAALAGGED